MEREIINNLIKETEDSPMFNYSDIWDAYVEGAKSGREKPTISDEIINKSADAYCKLQELKLKER